MNFSNKNPERKKLQEKGYYIVLFLCVVAVGISGYIFVSTAVRQSRDKAQLSVPITADKLPQEQQGSSPASGTVDDDPTANMSQEEKDELLRQAAKAEAVAPLQGEIIQEFSLEALSYNQTTRDWRLHAAVDIAADDAQVVSCMAGTVTEVFQDEQMGQTVVVTHDGGYETRYANLSQEVAVSVGDTLRPGDAIGTAGQTGLLEQADAAHLHFQVLLYGQPVDPTEFLS